MSKVSGEDRLLMVYEAYALLEKTLGRDHERTKMIGRYYHEIIGSTWARKKLYEIGRSLDA